MPEPSLISVVIPARNAGARLASQLGALADQQWEGRWEVVVADNGSTDDTVARTRDWAGSLPELRVVDASETAGAAHARNRGAQEARGDYLLFVDADDVVQQGWLAAMAAAAADHDLIAGRSEPVASPVRPGEAKGADETVESPPEAGLGRATRWSGILPSAGFLDAAASNNLGVSREAWNEIGGFREDLVASEDTALCWDLQLIGHRIHRVPDAVVHYAMRGSLSDLWRQQYRWGVAAAQLYAVFGDRGVPRSSTAGALARWAGLLVTAPAAIFSLSARRDWVGRAARRCGRIAGSARYRVLFL